MSGPLHERLFSTVSAALLADVVGRVEAALEHLEHGSEADAVALLRDLVADLELVREEVAS
jgi:hypothetical protein